MLLSTDVWVSGLIRRAEIAGAFATVVKKGDARAGTVILKAYNSSQRSARLYSAVTGPDGEPLWMQPVASAFEHELDDYIERQRRYDPDLWVVEVEDREGRHFLQERVQDT